MKKLVERAKKEGIKVLHVGGIGIRISNDTPRPNITPRPQGKTK
jgi:hypothetical protein